MLRRCLLSLLLPLVPCLVSAGPPHVLFDQSQIPELRQRITRPEFSPIWNRILSDAEGYCDPESPRYADPADPYPVPEKSRHNALLVHRVGRSLTDRMEAIGLAYQLAGRQDLGRHGARLLLATAREYPVTHPTISKGFAGGRGDVMRGLAMGYDLLSDQLDEADRKLVADACADYLDFFVAEFNDPKSWWYGIHNYNGVNGGSAGCLALALRDDFPDRADVWVAECVKIIGRWLSTGFDEDGACLEGVSYSCYGLSNTVLFAHALARHGDGDLFAHPTFRRLEEYYALSLLPGEGVFDARNDSSYSGLNVSALGLAAALRSGLYRWLWEETGDENSFLQILWHNDTAAVDPAAAGVPTARHFRGRGLCVWRTGWTDRDVMFSMEAGPYYPVTHNQADKGHFTLYGLGHRWAVDTGYANEHEPKGRGQTVGHSCVLVDGRGQALSGAGLGTSGRIAHYDNNARFGYALADCTEAYNRNNKGTPGAVVEHARRHAFFLYPRDGTPAYAVLMDDIRKDDQPHDYVWQMIYADDTAVTLGQGLATLRPVQTSGSGYVDTPFDVPADARRGSCVLEFEIQQPALYALWARVRSTDGTPGQADSFFVQIDGAPRTDWHMPKTNRWTWAEVKAGVEQTPVRLDLQPGKHRLTLQMREPGAQIDCVWLSTDPRKVPAVPSDGKDPLFLETEEGRVAGAMRTVKPDHIEPRLLVRIDAARQPAISTDVFEPEDYHGPARFPRLRAMVNDVEPRFLAVLLPLPSAVEEPEVRFESIADKRLVRIAWPSHTDVLEWPAGDGMPRLLESP